MNRSNQPHRIRRRRERAVVILNRSILAWDMVRENALQNARSKHMTPQAKASWHEYASMAAKQIIRAKVELSVVLERL
jgi:hypothetical protein